MRTTLNVDDRLFDELMRLTQAKTKTEAVHVALNGRARWKVENENNNTLKTRGLPPDPQLRPW
jgi:Arc/MetJ family transcription regulator